MKKIMVVFTGGTIGCKVSNKTIDVDESTGYLLVEKFLEKSRLDVEFETVQPINILSENCTPQDWSRMIQAIKKINMGEFDGIIITHGSDTLPYTAAIISYLFAATKIPIVLTASNYALDQSKSNGLRNFISSVEFICYSGIPGIFTVFEDDKGVEKVYLSTRIHEADPVNDQYTGFGGAELGHLESGKLILNKANFNPAKDELTVKRETLKFDRIEFKNRILAIRPYPGLDYSNFKFDKKNKPSAIVHTLYHSSTGCTREGDVSLPAFIKYCNDQGVDFYLASFKNTTGELYRTSKELLENGAIPLQNISFEAAVAKLWLAYNLEVGNPIEFVKRERYFEFIKK